MDCLRRIGLLIALTITALAVAAVSDAAERAPSRATATGAPFISEDVLRGLDEVGGAIIVPDSSGKRTVASLDAIERAWIAGFRGKLSDSTVADPSPVARLAGAQAYLIDDLLAAAKADPDRRSVSGSALGPTEVVAAIENLVGLRPILQAVHASRQSALLVVSSVSCECERERCEKMLKVFDSVAAAGSGLPMSVVDVIHMPAAGDPLKVTTIPSWVLFGPDGGVASTIPGFEESGDARKAVSSWLGLGEQQTR